MTKKKKRKSVNVVPIQKKKKKSTLFTVSDEECLECAMGRAIPLLWEQLVAGEKYGKALKNVSKDESVRAAYSHNASKSSDVHVQDYVTDTLYLELRKQIRYTLMNDELKTQEERITPKKKFTVEEIGHYATRTDGGKTTYNDYMKRVIVAAAHAQYLELSELASPTNTENTPEQRKLMEEMIGVLNNTFEKRPVGVVRWGGG